ncbi:hypothetical protein AB1Y20_019320 [Prymnesium parvum]|uniref:EamA domain-containing protein n=1 Tax=Prymnesium parvum TaxID=97485 RepID=A0AB34JUN8_PRYPA
MRGAGALPPPEPPPPVEPPSPRSPSQQARAPPSAPRPNWWASRLFCAKFWLVATGVWWGIAMQLLVYRGAGEPTAFLPNVDWYVGMMLLYFVRCCGGGTEMYANAQHRHVIPITLCDLLGTVGTTVGLELAGSAIFGIIYSSVTVWTALFTCVILRKAQSTVKLLGIVTVVLGLCLPALDPSRNTQTQDGQNVFIGIVLTSSGTLFYALEYTLCERCYSLYDKPLDARQLCAMTGVWGFFFTMIWIAGYTIPHWETVVSAPVRFHHSNVWVIGLLFASHIVNNAVHNAAWFVVCELEGGVSTGLLMGVKAAALFFGSALFFCDEEHSEQCLTTYKFAATVVVLVGTGVYYWPASSESDDTACCLRGRCVPHRKTAQSREAARRLRDGRHVPLKTIDCSNAQLKSRADVEDMLDAVDEGHGDESMESDDAGSSGDDDDCERLGEGPDEEIPVRAKGKRRRPANTAGGDGGSAQSVSSCVPARDNLPGKWWQSSAAGKTTVRSTEPNRK